MQYLIFVDDEDSDNFGDEQDDETVIYTAPVPEEDANYLRQAITALRPLSDDEYLNGPVVCLETMARYSYVLDGNDLYWLIEWEPGLLVVRFRPNEGMAWTAVRSPVPNFGGREASESEMDAYDEDAPNPQYNLIFRPWDAQLDSEERETNGFVLADEETNARFDNATDHVNDLSDSFEEMSSTERKIWLAQCKENIQLWTK
jgi:hypothetical protein